MNNIIGANFKQYKDVIIRTSVIGEDVMVGDDSFITDSIIGNHCSIERRSMIFNSTLADYSYTGYNNVIKFATIGKFTCLGWNVSCGGVNHDMSHLTMHPFPILKKYRFVNEDEVFKGFEEKLKIGNDVWIGSGVSILRNVSISDGAVIGAGAVVTRNIGPYEIWAGIPAKKIGQRFSDDIIERLINLSWWDLPIEFISKHIEYFKSDLTSDSLNSLIELSNVLEENY